MSTSKGGSVSVSAVEDLIRGLSSVQHARVVVNDWGGVEEVHVLADASRHPKAVVRDVESSLAARWGLIVDHKRISVAQLVGLPPRPKWVRLQIQRLAVTSDPVSGAAEVEVTLTPARPRDIFGRPVYDPEVPQESWQGRAEGPSSGGLAMRLAAEATIGSLNQALAPGHGFALEDIARLPVGGHEIIACLVHHRGPRGTHELVSGSVVLHGEPVEAAVRAVLAATNRLYGIALRLASQPHGGLMWGEGAVHEWMDEAAAGADRETRVEPAVRGGEPLRRDEPLQPGQPPRTDEPPRPGRSDAPPPQPEPS